MFKGRVNVTRVSWKKKKETTERENRKRERGNNVPFGGVEATAEERETDPHDGLGVASGYTRRSHWLSREL